MMTTLSNFLTRQYTIVELKSKQSGSTSQSRQTGYWTTTPNIQSQWSVVATAFIKRVLTISHRSYHPENKTIIEKILRKKHFPERIIGDLWRKVNGSMARNKRSHGISYPFIDQTTIVNGSLIFNSTANGLEKTCNEENLQELTESTTQKSYVGMGIKFQGFPKRFPNW